LARVIAILAWAGLALAASGCGQLVSMPIVGVGPFESMSGAVLDDAMRAARASGYPPASVDRERGRFAVTSWNDPRRETQLVVQCSRDGWIVITAEGGRAVREGEVLRVPRAVLDEIGSLATAIERGVSGAR
jgi:hypothetical protein